MVGILIVAHGKFGDALIANVEHVLGHRPPRLLSVSVEADEPTNEIERKIGLAMGELDDGSGVLVLNDICGATPCNAATRVCNSRPNEVVSGVNLPMLLRALSYRDEPLSKLVERAIAGGRDGVMRMTKENAHATSRN